jgi:predicted lysophospholipase L1 biosynthesis ABC-type transport system permease subunit
MRNMVCCHVGRPGITEVSALAASTVEVLMLKVVVLVDVVVIGSLFTNSALVVVAAVRRKRYDFEMALKLGLGRKARAGEATARSGIKQDLYLFQRITIVE